MISATAPNDNEGRVPVRAIAPVSRACLLLEPHDHRVSSRRSKVLYRCCTSTLDATSEAPPDFSERASDLVLYLVAGAGFEPATFGL
jgi:hypothetical protein